MYSFAGGSSDASTRAGHAARPPREVPRPGASPSPSARTRTVAPATERTLRGIEFVLEDQAALARALLVRLPLGPPKREDVLVVSELLRRRRQPLKVLPPARLRLTRVEAQCAAEELAQPRLGEWEPSAHAPPSGAASEASSASRRTTSASRSAAATCAADGAASASASVAPVPSAGRSATSASAPAAAARTGATLSERIYPIGELARRLASSRLYSSSERSISEEVSSAPPSGAFSHAS